MREVMPFTAARCLRTTTFAIAYAQRNDSMLLIAGPMSRTGQSLGCLARERLPHAGRDHREDRSSAASGEAQQMLAWRSDEYPRFWDWRFTMSNTEPVVG